MTDFQHIWIVETYPNYRNTPFVSCWDWYFDKADALAQFKKHCDTLFVTHDVAIYRIAMPISWDRVAIQGWCEDNINCIPIVHLPEEPQCNTPSSTDT